MELLCYLQPHAHLKHWLLVGHICAAWPKLAEEYVISTGIGTLCMDDSLAITKLGVIIKLLRIAVKSISGFLREARLHKMSTEDAQALAVKINQWCGQLLPTKVLICTECGTKKLTRCVVNSDYSLFTRFHNVPGCFVEASANRGLLHQLLHSSVYQSSTLLYGRGPAPGQNSIGIKFLGL